MTPRRSIASLASTASPAMNAWLRSVLTRSSNRRFRAVNRRGLRTSARHALILIMLAMIVDIVWLVPTHPGAAVRLAVANLAAGGAALLAHAFLGHRRAHAELVMFCILLGVDATILLVAGIDTELARVSAGYVVLMPLLVALLIPWGTRIHLAWLVLHGLVSVAATETLRTAGGDAGGRAMDLLLVFVSIGSVVGHLSAAETRFESFRRLEQIKAMHRQLRRDEAQLRGLNGSLERLARTDQLTGLGNRTALHRALAGAQTEAGRSGAIFGLLLLDLDHFKSINDVRGHVVGDEVLRRVARTIDGTTRDSDVAYRFGGEEFVCLVPLDRVDDLAAVAERVRAAVEGLTLDHPSNPPFGVVTVSVGARLLDRGSCGASADDLLRDADDAMYRAKRAGRNRVELCPVARPSSRRRRSAARQPRLVARSSGAEVGAPA